MRVLLSVYHLFRLRLHFIAVISPYFQEFEEKYYIITLYNYSIGAFVENNLQLISFFEIKFYIANC